MERAWKNLVNLNNERKYLKNKPTCRVVKQEDKWVLLNSRDENRVLTIDSYSDILGLLLLNKRCYIRNLSMLKNSSVLKRYFIQRDWYVIYSILVELEKLGNLDTLNIIRVDNIEEWVSKRILLGKNVVNVTEDNAYSIITIDNVVFLISELTFVIDTAHYIRLKGLWYKKVYISNFDISDLYRLDSFFAEMYKLKVVELKNFDTRNVRNFSYMFAEDSNLEVLNIEEIRTDKAIDMRKMFKHCRKLYNLDFGHFIWNENVKVTKMFLGCVLLKPSDMNIPDKIILEM